MELWSSGLCTSGCQEELQVISPIPNPLIPNPKRHNEWCRGALAHSLEPLFHFPHSLDAREMRSNSWWRVSRPQPLDGQPASNVWRCGLAACHRRILVAPMIYRRVISSIPLEQDIDTCCRGVTELACVSHICQPPPHNIDDRGWPQDPFDPA